MKIAVLGAGRVGSTIGRLWHAAGHDVTFTARHATRPRALARNLAIAVRGLRRRHRGGRRSVLVAVPAAVKHLSPEMQITALHEE